MQVVDFMQDTHAVLPPVVRFEGVEGAISLYRLATFTGSRFFRSCAMHFDSGKPSHARGGRSTMSTGASGGRGGTCGPTQGRNIFVRNNSGNSDTVLTTSSPATAAAAAEEQEPAYTGGLSGGMGGGIDVQECDPATLACLLRIVESKASATVSLRQACNLFSAVEYCLAEKLPDLLFDYLAPLVEKLTAKEVRDTRPRCMSTPDRCLRA
jgi:hypothetical protein